MKLLKLLPTILLLLLLQNCISLPSNNLPTVGSNDVQFLSDQPIKIFTEWNFDSSLPFIDQEKMMAAHQKLLMNSIEEIACCVVVQSAEQADVVVRGNFSKNGNPNAAQLSVFASALLYIIPSWMDVKVNLSATVSNYGAQRVYNLSDSMMIVQWLPLVVAMPFNTNPISQENNMNQNIYRNLFLQIEKDGFLE